METANPAPGLATPAKKQNEAVVIGASSVGTMFEWYDFFLYGSLAANITHHFFSGVNEATGFILALAAFASGFIVRPFGALFFGRIGDIVGRKNTFLVTMIIMGASTFVVGLLPSYNQIGILAPIALVVLRVLQGLAIGGEYGGAAVYVAEHAPHNRRGFFTSWIQITATLGLFASLLLIMLVRNLTTPEQFNDWGWRIPFLMSILLLGVSIWIRLQLSESPIFQKMKDEATTSKAPLAEAFGTWSNLKYVFIALFGCVAGQAVIWYTGTFYGLFFLQNTLKVDGLEANLIVALALGLGTPFYIFFGWLSDKVGRKPLVLLGLFLGAVCYVPLFHTIAQYANPKLVAAETSSPVVVTADSEACSLQFDPVGKNKFDGLSCDIVKDHLTRAGVGYTVVDAPDAVASVQVGSAAALIAPEPSTLTEPERAAAVAAFKKQLAGALAAAGYPAKADPAGVNRWMVVGLLMLATVFTAMIYGPMAAMLVELFPARVRYTSMSLPYHIGNGWFGGLLPTIAFAIVAGTGNIYAGIWYPVVIAAITLVFAVFFLPETKNRDIHQ